MQVVGPKFTVDKKKSKVALIMTMFKMAMIKMIVALAIHNEDTKDNEDGDDDDDAGQVTCSPDSKGNFGVVTETFTIGTKSVQVIHYAGDSDSDTDADADADAYASDADDSTMKTIENSTYVDVQVTHAIKKGKDTVTGLAVAEGKISLSSPKQLFIVCSHCWKWFWRLWRWIRRFRRVWRRVRRFWGRFRRFRRFWRLRRVRRVRGIRG